MARKVVVRGAEVYAVVALRDCYGLAPLVVCLVELVEQVVPATGTVQLLRFLLDRLLGH